MFYEQVFDESLLMATLFSAAPQPDLRDLSDVELTFRIELTSGTLPSTHSDSYSLGASRSWLRSSGR